MAIKKERKMKEVVEFYLQNTGPCTPFNSGPVKQISSFEDLAHYVACYSSSLPYKIEIKRIVYTLDTGRYVTSGRSTLGQKRCLNNHPIIDKKTTDKFVLLVGNKLAYPADVARFLTEQYGSALDFNAIQKDKPVMLDKIQTVMAPGKQTRSAQWHYLTENDVFVDRNMNQLWPINTGTVPAGLVEMFNKKER